ncbi:MAG: S1C family serine protease [Treponema sp.]
MRRQCYVIMQGLVCCLFCLVACTSVVYQTAPAVDYMDKGSVEREIEAVSRLVGTEPLEALVRAKRLHAYSGTCAASAAADADGITALYADATAAVQKLFEQARADCKWAEALRLFNSLIAVGVSLDSQMYADIIKNRQMQWQQKGYAALVPDASVSSTARAANSPLTEVVQHLFKACVTIWVDLGLKVEKGVGSANRVIGSGFFIDPSGYIVTNYHVIQSEVDPEYEGYSRLYIKVSNSSGQTSARIPAKVIGWDPLFDLALLKTEMKPEAVFVLGSSADLKIGSKVYAMGSPVGLEQTLTSGIVSARNRQLFALGTALQIDVPVNPGNSGGPLIDESGRVQAIVFAGLADYEGLNFAIPVELLQTVLPHLYEGGKVPHSWTGGYGRTVEGFAGEDIKGVQLVYAIPGSPAAQIPQGAVITQINGTAVHSLEVLQKALLQISPDTLVVVSGYEPLSRDTLIANENTGKLEQKDWYLITQTRPDKPAKQIYYKDSKEHAALPLYGLHLESAGKRNAFRIKEVLPDSYADEAGFSSGDYIEISALELEEDEDMDEFLCMYVYAKRRKGGYLESFMEFPTYLDSSSYF